MLTDRLLSEPAQLVAVQHLHELILVLDEPDPVQRLRGVDLGRVAPALKQHSHPADLVGDPDPPRIAHLGDIGNDLRQQRQRLEIDAKAALAVEHDLVGLSQRPGHRRLVEHHCQCPRAVLADHQAGRAAVVAGVSTQVGDVLRTEHDAGVERLLRHPLAQPVEPVRRARERDAVSDRRTRWSGRAG